MRVDIKRRSKKTNAPTMQGGEFYLEGRTKRGKRRFKVNKVPSPHGSSDGSFQITEIVDGQTVVRGYSLSWPTFSDACYVSEQSLSNRPIRTHTYELKEKRMAVKKKSPESTVALAPGEAEKFMEIGHAPKGPKTAIVVQAKDGKWVYGLQVDEKKLLEMAKGQYDSAADASEAATKDHDIIINTGPAPTAAKKKSWDLGTSTAPTPGRTAVVRSMVASDAVSLKKVCADAAIDPKLARRILRAKAAKPGGRWEWTKEEAPKIVELLKKGLAERTSKPTSAPVAPELAKEETKKPSTVIKKPTVIKKKSVIKKPKKVVKKGGKKK